MAATDSVAKAAQEPRSAVALRRQFALPVEDIEALDASGFTWETVVDGGTQWLFIRDWPLPPGFTANVVTIGVRIVAGYPSAALDMVYVHPPLVRVSGGAIGAVSDTVIDGRTFQQWSRHYSPQNPWRPDVDSIATHLRLIDTWFARAVA